MSEVERTFDWIPPTPQAAVGNAPFRLSLRAEAIRTDRAPRSYAWTRRAWLDQGSEGACTGFGAAHVMSMAPEARTMTNAHGNRFYKGAQRYDEWPGENYEGSSVLGVMKYLRAETGFVREYWWAQTLDEIIQAIGYYGPVEIGSYWWSGMMNTHEDGYVRPTGGKVGGHAYALGAVDLKNRRFRLDNSWGRGWGVNGSAWLDFTDMKMLLADDGECALPRKTRP